MRVDVVTSRWDDPWSILGLSAYCSFGAVLGYAAGVTLVADQERALHRSSFLSDIVRICRIHSCLVFSCCSLHDTKSSTVLSQ